MPCDLVSAIDHAMVILAWHEHLGEKEMPPRWMWGLPDELEAHFDWVKQDRLAGTSHDDDDDEGGGMMIKNEYARGRGRNAR